MTIKESFDKKSYLEAVVKAKNHIVEGDAFQIVLSRREEITNHPEPFEIYRALRTINPSPYLFYLEMDGQIITGSSPEMLVKVENRKVQVRPIAGTRPRISKFESETHLFLQASVAISYAIRDAVAAVSPPVVEVHLSDIRSREEFRKISVIEPVAAKQFSGESVGSYLKAIDFLLSL